MAVIDPHEISKWAAGLASLAGVSGASSQDAPMLPSTRCRCAGRSRVDSGRCSSDSPGPTRFLQQTFATHTVPSDRRRGGNARRDAFGSDTHSTQQANANRRERTTIKPGGYNIKSPVSDN